MSRPDVHSVDVFENSEDDRSNAPPPPPPKSATDDTRPPPPPAAILNTNQYEILLQEAGLEAWLPPPAFVTLKHKPAKSEVIGNRKEGHVDTPEYRETRALHIGRVRTRVNANTPSVEERLLAVHMGSNQPQIHLRSEEDISKRNEKYFRTICSIYYYLDGQRPDFASTFKSGQANTEALIRAVKEIRGALTKRFFDPYFTTLEHFPGFHIGEEDWRAYLAKVEAGGLYSIYEWQIATDTLMVFTDDGMSLQPHNVPTMLKAHDQQRLNQLSPGTLIVRNVDRFYVFFVSLDEQMDRHKKLPKGTLLSSLLGHPGIAPRSKMAVDI
ncbi:hypothetical protein EJ02DRAFT_421972 [Clathrospora elynae]|uniref:Uncharacterized protein n=1 Tax=Clathrospora elynae TaxID=706981 RepID=A0A6A5SSK7_9PLEO|nr:hypothetical protein EJ02DRAFT_421972 [Clathrospora elynae]